MRVSSLKWEPGMKGVREGDAAGRGNSTQMPRGGGPRDSRAYSGSQECLLCLEPTVRREAVSHVRGKTHEIHTTRDSALPVQGARFDAWSGN